MTCRKVRKLIPLAAGGDLRPRQARAVRAHLDACLGCRAELEDFRTALAGFKAAARAESIPDWSEGEWKALMTRAEAGRKTAGETERPAGPGLLGPRWAVASALGVLAGLAVLSVLFRGPSPRPGQATSAEARGQDVLTMTMVSPDTGLQVVWILDKNFDWKGDRQ